ncbi:predicted protein [Sclerotinia sclerotiorum 1980 UF-70]|uniref:Uncharacterized protein n=1 Tax=Sclerotinia sclerotiorum (strain ATCC 18683 / 1980 / Ss-1) TaxID=665079 RepID=A7EGC2_SCLS1|nr:predicted protein [Sclerotinia sclerotiorum 1980 UF-70]EDO01888.1 predicted protein [Sclerotinia sclerotiorum 1980 UF-70]
MGDLLSDGFNKVSSQLWSCCKSVAVEIYILTPHACPCSCQCQKKLYSGLIFHNFTAKDETMRFGFTFQMAFSDQRKVIKPLLRRESIAQNSTQDKEAALSRSTTYNRYNYADVESGRPLCGGDVGSLICRLQRMFGNYTPICLCLMLEIISDLSRVEDGKQALFTTQSGYSLTLGCPPSRQPMIAQLLVFKSRTISLKQISFDICLGSPVENS